MKHNKNKPRRVLIDEAKAKGKTQYSTGKPCRNGHTANRWVADGKCIECSYTKKRRQYAKAKTSGKALSGNPSYTAITSTEDKALKEKLEKKKAWRKEYHRKDMRKRHSIRRGSKITSYRLKKYGITEKDFYEALEKQSRRCSICKKYFRSFSEIAIDHCHASGKFRELLCNNCNSGLGFFRDNVESIKAAAKYIEKHTR